MNESARRSMNSLLANVHTSRRGRQLQLGDYDKILAALPKDVPERTWAEVFQNEDEHLFLYDIREEILEDALNIAYDAYMERRKVSFTVHCAVQAWLKLIDWHFYRHDPGEDTSAYPPCFIPKRQESWTPDEMPDPSPKDSWARTDLRVEEMIQEEPQESTTLSTVEIPVIEEIPSEYWFPGKINLPEHQMERARRNAAKMMRMEELDSSQDYASSGTSAMRSPVCTESEVLQKVTDYNQEELSDKTPTHTESEVVQTRTDSSLRGAGDSVQASELQPKKKERSGSLGKRRGYSKASVGTRSRRGSPSSESTSQLTPISDCRLRSLRYCSAFYSFFEGPLRIVCQR